MYNINNQVFTWVILVQVVFAQSITRSDSLFLIESDSVYYLKYTFILPETFNAYIDDKKVEPDSLEPIKGIVLWKNQLNQRTKVSLSYESLNTGLPIAVGPKWKLLPGLDTIVQNKSVENIENRRSIEQNDGSDIISSGTFHRQLSLSPFSGSEFSGGMRIQINGKLTDEIMVSGILSDQDLPIQPEGTTRNLEDLQQVYLTVQHPEFNVSAGDIDFIYSHDKIININRRLIGLNNTFNYNTWSGSTIYATTKGRYISVEFKGQDSNQGPYSLTSESKSRDIIVLAGSEKIWVDGIKMIRGENYDYIIDYSMGEITFTPKQLIHDDTDVFVEYQYIDTHYSKNIVGGAFDSHISMNTKITAGFFREQDQVNKELFDTETLNKLMISGDKPIIRSGVVRNDIGEYHLKIIAPNDSIYVYDPEKNLTNERYFVSFSYNSIGEYQRKVSSNGRVYYEFVPEMERSENFDLYSPFKTVIAPSDHGLLFASSEWYMNDNMVMKFSLAGSDVDDNSLSDKDDAMNSSMSYRLNFTADSIQTGLFRIGFTVGDQYKQENFESFEWDKSIRHRRFWDLDTVASGKERQREFSLNLDIEDFSTTKIELAKLNIFNKVRNRTNLIHEFFHPFLSGSRLEHYSVTSYHGLYNFTKGLINLNIGTINPFVKFEIEDDPSFKKYGIFGGGINFQNKTTTWNSGIQIRDESFTYKNNAVSPLLHNGADITGYFDYSQRSKNGWRKNIIIKHRSKTIDDQSSNLNYLLGRLHLSFRMPLHPIIWELKLESEETLTQQRSVVYDSIGVGMGQYRYDANFNTYVSDPNGPFISYSIPTGIRNPTTVLEGLHRFIVDFGKLSGYPELLFRSETRLDFRGRVSSTDVILNPSLNDSSIVGSQWSTRAELDWKSQNVFQHIRSWSQYSRDLQGLDPRGNDLSKKFETGFEFTGNRYGIMQLRSNSLYRTYKTMSMFSNMRNRNINGSWNELHLIIKSKNNIDLNAGAKYGHDIGKYQGGAFDATNHGIELIGQVYIGSSGRLQLQMEWNSVNENHGLNILPPEALNGLPVGKDKRFQTRFQYLFNRNISLVLSLNTIHNQRYENLFNILGEFRALF